jgi:hypothetical protein
MTALSHTDRSLVTPVVRPYAPRWSTAVGDVRHGSVERVASTVGEGSIAIQFVHRLLAT